MKKLLTVIIITLIIFILVGCEAQPEIPQEPIDNKGVSPKIYDNNSKNNVIVYYTKEGFLIPVTVKASNTETVEAVEFLFEKKPPLGLNSELTDVELIDCDIDGENFFVDVSASFLKGSQAEVRCAQLTNTIFEDEDINQVSITVEGKPYKTITQRPKYINLIECDDLGCTEDYLTIYYADSSKTYIVPVTIKSNKLKEIRKKDKDLEPDERAEIALLHIFEGPKDIDNLTGIFPDDIKLKKFWIEDGIAYMDVDIKLLLGLVNEKQYEKIAVESIVQTLTEIDGIEKIQFLINGKQWTSISGHVNISNPIERYEWYNEIEPF